MFLTKVPNNIHNPKGIPGYEFIGWHLDRMNLTRTTLLRTTSPSTRSTKACNLHQQQLPSEVDRNYVFEAWWQPSEVTVYLSAQRR